MLSPKYSRLILAVAIAALLNSGACSRKRAAQAAPPLVIVQTEPQREATEPPPTTPTNPTEAKPAAEPPAPSPGLIVPPAKKGSTRPATRATTPPETPTPQPTDPPKPTSPRMSPRMSPAQQAQYEKKTNAAINTAEKNMQTAYGKQLNSAQNDMLEKTRGFLSQAREAMRAGDWQRAFNLSEKARVLSVELVNSL